MIAARTTGTSAPTASAYDHKNAVAGKNCHHLRRVKNRRKSSIRPPINVMCKPEMTST